MAYPWSKETAVTALRHLMWEGALWSVIRCFEIPQKRIYSPQQMRWIGRKRQSGAVRGLNPNDTQFLSWARLRRVERSYSLEGIASSAPAVCRARDDVVVRRAGNAYS